MTDINTETTETITPLTNEQMAEQQQQALRDYARKQISCVADDKSLLGTVSDGAQLALSLLTTLQQQLSNANDFESFKTSMTKELEILTPLIDAQLTIDLKGRDKVIADITERSAMVCKNLHVLYKHKTQS